MLGRTGFKVTARKGQGVTWTWTGFLQPRLSPNTPVRDCKSRVLRSLAHELAAAAVGQGATTA